MSNDSTPGGSLGVHRRPPTAACREASRRAGRGGAASGALVTVSSRRGSQRDHFIWLLWRYQAIQATLCSQRRAIMEACTGHALVMDHAIISNAKVIHVVLLPHLAFPAPCPLPSSLHHQPSSTLHPPAPCPTFHPLPSTSTSYPPPSSLPRSEAADVARRLGRDQRVVLP